ncbi:MAG: hypothetical protein ACXVA9_07100, partial [Bdellovibrionales bacterium]
MRSCFKLLFVLVLACGPKAVFAHDAPPYPNCETRLMLQERMTQKLGYTPLFDTSIMKPFTKMEGARRFMITAKHPRFGMVLAFLDYTSYDEGQTLDLDKV